MESLRAVTSLDNSERFPWIELASAVAAYILIVFALCPGNPLIGFPIHHDDFTALGSEVGFSWLGPRPVSYVVIGALSAAGIPAYYICLHALVIAYAFFSLMFLRSLLDVPKLTQPFSLLAAAAALSFENTVEYSKYTGLITSLLSGVFAVAAMWLMVRERQRVIDALPLRWAAIVAIWALVGLSFWSKEDFVLPAILLSAYLAWEARRDVSAHKSRWLVLAVGIILLGGLMVQYNQLVKSAYTQSTSGVYRPNFSVFSIYRTGITYLLITKVAVLASALQGLTLILNAVAPAPVRWSRLLLYQLLIASLVLPYACLPLHVAVYYALNWIVWQIGGALYLLWQMKERRPMRWTFGALAIVCIILGQPGRQAVTQWYIGMAQLNRNIVSTLRAGAEELRPYRTVVVEGAPMLGPWFASRGGFLARCGLEHEWVVRVPKESQYYRTLVQLLGATVLGQIRTVAMEEEPRPAGLPVVRLFPDGTGVVELPGRRGERRPAPPRILKLYPEMTTAGARFNTQPSGQSAIAVEGSGFAPDSCVLFDGTPLPTAYGNPGLISAIVPDALISTVKTVKVSVRNSEGSTSDGAPFQIVSRARGR